MQSWHTKGTLALLQAALLCLMPFALAAQEKAVSWSEMWNLRFRKTDEVLFTDTEHAFCVEIADVSPDRVQVTVNSLPQNASLISSKKESVTIKRSSGKVTSGTRITLWMEFSKSGFYQIDPVDVVIDKGFYRIPVGTVEVFENPRFISPQLSLSFEGKDPTLPGASVEQGECVVFTVSVRGAAQVKDVHWQLPQDCIFKRVESYPLPSGTSPLSKEFIPLAKFQWWPLRVGTHTFPRVFVDAVCFNGSHTQKSLPEVQITVLPKTHYEDVSTAATSSTEAFLKRTFSSSDKEEGSSFHPATAAADVEHLSSLKRGQVRLFAALALAAVILLLLCVLLVPLGKRRIASLALAAAVVCAVCCALISREAFALRAVVTEGQLYPIPQKEAAADVTLVRDSVVFVERLAGEWALVRCGDESGWIARTEIHLIK